MTKAFSFRFSFLLLSKTFFYTSAWRKDILRKIIITKEFVSRRLAKGRAMAALRVSQTRLNEPRGQERGARPRWGWRTTRRDEHTPPQQRHYSPREPRVSGKARVGGFYANKRRTFRDFWRCFSYFSFCFTFSAAASLPSVMFVSLNVSVFPTICLSLSFYVLFVCPS